MRGSRVVRLDASIVLFLVFVNFCFTEKEKKKKKKENCCHSRKLFPLQMKCFSIFAKVFYAKFVPKITICATFCQKFCNFLISWKFLLAKVSAPKVLESSFQLSLEKKVEETKIEFHLTISKPLLAKWLVEYYNEITSKNGSSVIINGWKAAGIYDAIKTGSSGLQSIDPFEDISPLVTEHDESESFLPATIDQLTDELRENFVNVPFDEENSKWEQSDNKDDVDSECNIFDDIIIDDE